MKKLLIIIFTLMTFACKQKENNLQTTDSNEVEIPKEFVDFYNQFHSDSLFQLKHIVFPLSQKSDSTQWLRSEWKMHQAFDDQDGSFVREFDNFNGIIIETIREKNNMFLMKRRFAPSGNSYNLIFYSIDNKLDQWGERNLEIIEAEDDVIIE